MPTPTTYTYSIAADTANGRVEPTTLTDEIQASSIVTALDGIETAGDVLSIIFKDALSTGDKTTLDGVIAAHQGDPVFDRGPADVVDLTQADSRLIRRFGQLTSTATNEVLLYPRTYAEPATQAQRSVKSTSAQDGPSGSGAKQVRITYLDSNYVLKTEDVTLNGTTAVNTAATDIRFIECMEVIQGTDAAGAITLMTQTGGSGTEIAGIGVATSQSFFCHHYVPAGKKCYLLKWSAVADDEVSLKLKSQDRVGANLVERISDLEKMFASNPSPPTRLSFERELQAVVAPEKTYVRVTVVPNQTTSTTIRGTLYLLEIAA